MENFKAMFWGSKVYINEKHQYPNNGILVQYLNFDTKDLEEIWRWILERKGRIELYMGMGENEKERYDERVWDMQRKLRRVDNLLLALPPFTVCLDERENHTDRLFYLLNQYPDLFENGGEESDFGPTEYEDSNQYGYLTCDENGEDLFHLTHFIETDLMDKRTEYNDYLDEDMQKCNAAVQRLLEGYAGWIEDVLRVKYVYAKLLEKYLHIRHAFLGQHEVAAQLEKYLQAEKPGSKPYLRLGSAQPKAVAHKVIHNAEGQPILCDSYEFDRIGAFLYTDFFKGLQNNYLPKKCGNCGRWFLLPFGKYSDYCENPLAEQPGKTCRDIGSHKKYMDKCKTDPVWLAYNRAYKAHYARYMKKKMTNAEFEQWSRYAVELRTKALDGTLDLEEYQRLIKM